MATSPISADDTFVRVERDGAIAIITLDRPHRRNAVVNAMGRELESAFLSAGTDSAVRVIVLCGAGGHFCAGGDMERLADIRDRGITALSVPPEADNPRFAAMTDAPPGTRTRYLLPMAVPQPVIAAIGGACAGAGLVLATACDLRVAAHDARFAAGFGRRGLIAENGIAVILPHLVGHAAAADLLIRGHRIDAYEARRIGLVGDVVPPGELLSRASNMAREIAREVSPRSATVIKRQLQATIHDLGRSLDRAAAELRAAIVTPDFAEGIAAFVEKRAPVFADRASQATA
ncbi:enoyl-CoA hydratase-related protein [Sphingomonas bacterium]|uniref:enoyl-CoA hydratase-related protein n=1 Tax=Sphingomonas bacterium TaxID=1895847 RepID=UPI001576D513|nr:enoyl-CoA hydratase-related protein [Sphingomonas bacterium]